LVSNPGAPSATITVLRNAGLGTFTPIGFSNVGPLPTTIDPADVDNDRDIDVVFLSTFVPPLPDPPQSQAGVLVNSDGKGALATATFTLVNGIADSLALADLNNDSFIDIVTNNRVLETVSYALNQSGQSFSGFVGLNLSGEPDAITAGDFNGDGTIDIAAVVPGVSGDELKPFPNLIAGSQQVQFDPTQPVDSLDGDSILIATADFDGGGISDVVTINDQSALASFAGGPPALASVL
jgi:hypothetical protein